MRVGMVAWSFYPSAGGSGTTVMQLSKALVERGIGVDIVAPLLQKDIYKIKGLNLDERIKIHWVISSFARGYADFYSRFIFFLKMIIKIRHLSRYVHIFHAHDFNISMFAAIIGTRKPVASIFGADPLFEIINYKRKKCIDYPLFLKKKIAISLQKTINSFISIISKKRLTVIGHNKYTNEIIGRYYSGPITDIPAGITLSLYKEDTAEKKSDEDTILFVARFACWKGLDIAVDVLREAKKRRKDLKMLCIGQGPLKEYYINKYKNVEGLAFITDLNYENVAEYYKKAGVLLATTQYETFGISIIEAMAAGLPIVASDLDVFHDRLIDNVNCYLVADGNVGIFADRVLDVLNNNSIRERFAVNSLDTVKDYSIDKICGKYIDLYNSLYIS